MTHVLEISMERPARRLIMSLSGAMSRGSSHAYGDSESLMHAQLERVWARRSFAHRDTFCPHRYHIDPASMPQRRATVCGALGIVSVWHGSDEASERLQKSLWKASEMALREF